MGELPGNRYGIDEPISRPSTQAYGESCDHQRTEYFTGVDRAWRGINNTPQRTIYSLEDDRRAENRSERFDAGTRWVVLSGHDKLLDLREAFIATHLRHVMGYLLPDHVLLLTQRYVEQLELLELAEERGITYQAVQQRIEVALQDFRREFGLHGLDDVEFGAADL